MFYDIFLDLCTNNGIKPYRFSQETGIGQSTISMWKKTGATPQGETLQRIADYFGVSVDYLLTGEEPKQKEAPGPEAESEIDLENELSVFLDSKSFMLSGKAISEESKQYLINARKAELEYIRKLEKEK